MEYPLGADSDFGACKPTQSSGIQKPEPEAPLYIAGSQKRLNTAQAEAFFAAPVLPRTFSRIRCEKSALVDLGGPFFCLRRDSTGPSIATTSVAREILLVFPKLPDSNGFVFRLRRKQQTFGPWTALDWDREK